MRITLGRYKCERCASSFEAPILGEFVYGKFLLWSANGHVAYLDTFEDETYDKVAELLEKRIEGLRTDRYELARVLKRVFGPMACDPDPTGAPYRIGALPPCPRCPGARIVSWAVIDPPKVVDLDIAIVSHIAWNRLSPAEQLAEVDRFVAGNAA